MSDKRSDKKFDKCWSSLVCFITMLNCHLNTMSGCELYLMSENLCLIENFQKFTLEKSDQSLLGKKSMHTIETNLHQLFSSHFQTSLIPDLELLDHLLNKRNLCLKH